jgi:hypothetical protein
MSEDNIVSMVPDVPATQQQHGVEVFGGYRWRPGHIPELLNRWDRRTLEAKVAPELLCHRAMEDEVI